MLLLPLVSASVRGLLKLTAVLVSAQVAAIDRPARVVAETPGLPLMAAWVGTSVAVACVPRVQFMVILAICCELAKSLLLSVPKGRLRVFAEPIEQAGWMTRKLRMTVCK